MTESAPEPTVAAAAARLQALSAESTDPSILGLAHFMAGRMHQQVEVNGRDLPLSPRSFITFSSLVILDLQRGYESPGREPIPDHPFAGQQNTDYLALFDRLPSIASAAVSGRFGHTVLALLVKGGIISPPEGPADAGELITEPITDIDTAYERIVEDAQQRVLALDWAALDASPERVRETMDSDFSLMYALILRQGRHAVPINIIHEQPGQPEHGYLTGLLSRQKREITPGYWLSMMMPEIPADLAMATRDLIFLRAVEWVASDAGTDRERVIDQLMLQPNGPYSRAAIRYVYYASQHPDFYLGPRDDAPPGP